MCVVDWNVWLLNVVLNVVLGDLNHGCFVESLFSKRFLRPHICNAKCPRLTALHSLHSTHCFRRTR